MAQFGRVDPVSSCVFPNSLGRDIIWVGGDGQSATRWSELVAHLNQLFKVFDTLTEVKQVSEVVRKGI